MKLHDTHLRSTLAAFGLTLLLLAVGILADARDPYLALALLAAALGAWGTMLWRLRGLEIAVRKRAEGLVAAQRDLARISATDATDAEAWQLCLAVALRVSGMDSAGLLLFAPEDGFLRLVAYTGVEAGFAAAASSHSPGSRNVALLNAGQPLYLSSDSPMATDLMREERLLSLAVIPILAQGRVVGCLNVGRCRPSRATPWKRSRPRSAAW